jgi:tellurium resistance protein TerD
MENFFCCNIYAKNVENKQLLLVLFVKKPKTLLYMLGVSLKKGESVNLTKKAPALRKMMIGLGWEVRNGNPLDLDASLFMLNKHGKTPNNNYFVFYNNLKSPDGAVIHTGDNRTGIGDGDDEMILANLHLINQDVSEILVLVTIHESEQRRHHFGLLKEAYIRIVDAETQKEVLTFDLDEGFPMHSEVEFGRLQKINNEWHFKASGQGSNIGLQGYVDRYL